ncbi:MAG: DUF4266 domain-containing protein [Cellvibrio sp.]
MRKINLVSVVFLALMAVQGCSTVKPWERGYLAKSEMFLVADPMQEKISSHIYHSKEGSSRISAGSGGGCGCN